MSNTIWNEWYYTDRFLNKPYPFIDNIRRQEIDEPKKIHKSKKEHKPKKRSKK